MNTKVKLLTIILFITGFIFGQKSEEKLVRTSFENYRSAILNDKGEEAFNCIDSRTVKYYSDMLELVKNADSTEVSNLSLMDKMMVLTIRYRVPKEEVLTLDGKGLFIYAVESGMVGKNSVANNSIGEITIDKEFAKGQFISNGKKSPLYFHFYKEDEQWKVDLTSIFPMTNIVFKQLAEKSGLSENEYVFTLIEMITGTKPGNEIWNKLIN
jgi:hypothetical protein